MYGCCTYDTSKTVGHTFPPKKLTNVDTVYVDRLHATNVRMRQRDILNLIIIYMSRFTGKA